jgi:N utilization substance protein A
MASRTHRNIIKRLFELEVPEIFEGQVEIKAIAREPGSRSKVAVWARQEGIDPIGACVGVRGTRINNIINELNGEKIDIILWSTDPAQFVANALSPVKPLHVELRDSDHTALVEVTERQLSLAIGKDGQNARLAARLTGWRVDVIRPSEQGERAASAAALPSGELNAEDAAPRVERQG